MGLYGILLIFFLIIQNYLPSIWMRKAVRQKRLNLF